MDLPNIASAIAAYYVIAPCEAFSNLARFDGVRYGYQEPGQATLAEQTSLSRAHGFGEEAKRRQMLGAYLLSSGTYDKYYYPAQQVRTLITADYARAYQKCDVILMPAAPRTAFKFGELSDPTQMYASDMFTISNNIVGNGGVSVPLGLGATSGLPVSAQLQVQQHRRQRRRLRAAGPGRHLRPARLRAAPGPGLRRRPPAHLCARDRAVLLAHRRRSPCRARLCREGG